MSPAAPASTATGVAGTHAAPTGVAAMKTADAGAPLFAIVIGV